MNLKSRQSAARPVRLGGPRRSRLPWVIGAALLAAVMAGWLALRRGQDSPSRSQGLELMSSCSRDEDCKARHICLEGGCAPLLSSQDPVVWHADLEQQLSSESEWKPPREAGEILPSTTACPAPRGEVLGADPGKLRQLFNSTIFEIKDDGITIHKHSKVAGYIWVDSIVFDFPGRQRIDPSGVCTGPRVAHVAVLQGVGDSLPGRVIASLRQAVPSNTPTSATISARFPLPEPGSDGARTLVIPLETNIASGKRVTVLALPLGAHIDAMGGPAPTEQRLLRGFFAYYFHHQGAPSEVFLSYRLHRPVNTNLDVTTVRP